MNNIKINIYYAYYLKKKKYNNVVKVQPKYNLKIYSIFCLRFFFRIFSIKTLKKTRRQNMCYFVLFNTKYVFNILIIGWNILIQLCTTYSIKYKFYLHLLLTILPFYLPVEMRSSVCEFFSLQNYGFLL